MKALFFTLVISVTGLFAMAQSSKEVNWTFTAKKVADKTYEVHCTAKLNGAWHIYAQHVGVDGPIPTTFTFTKNPLLTFDGKVLENGKVVKKNEEVWGGIVNYYEKTVTFVQKVKVKGSAKTNLAGKVEYMVCDDSQCLPPAETPFSISIGG